MNRWPVIQESIRACRVCRHAEGKVFLPFDNGLWPTLPQPRSQAMLFLSEAPPKEGGFWTVQSRGKQDDLREKLLPLLGLSTAGSDRGLTSFLHSGCYLLQSFPRPLRGRIAGIGDAKLKRLLEHQVKTHLRTQIEFFQPSAILALGVPAATAISMLWPGSQFARSFVGGRHQLREMRDRETGKARIFKEPRCPILSATYLPSGQGRHWRDFWEKDVPHFVAKVRDPS